MELIRKLRESCTGLNLNLRTDIAPHFRWRIPSILDGGVCSISPIMPYIHKGGYLNSRSDLSSIPTCADHPCVN